MRARVRARVRGRERVRVRVSDDRLRGAHRGVAHGFHVVGEAEQNERQHVGQEGLELGAVHCGEMHPQHRVALARGRVGCVAAAVAKLG